MEKTNLEWKCNLSAQEWDEFLAKYRGHPLQSYQWGQSKKISCGIKDHRWIAFQNDMPVFMARFEERRILKFLKISWCPKGPLYIDKDKKTFLQKEFLKKLKENRFFLCATNPWEKIDILDNKNPPFYTIWLDLTISKEKLWGNLNKQCRYDVKRAKKIGVIVEESKSLDDLNAFYEICESISKSKGFSLGNSAKMMRNMFVNNDTVIESCLLVAKYENIICGGAFLIRCGENVHYIWGAVNRSFSHLCIGEAIQWETIEWALSKNCKKYDLEGISTTNSGVDKFKKKLGGTIVPYYGLQIYPLSFGRTIIPFLINSYLLLQPKINKYKKFFLS